MVMNKQNQQRTRRYYFFNHAWERSQHKARPMSSREPAISALLLTVLALCLAACASPTSRDRRAANVAEPTPIPTAVVPNKPLYEVARGDVITIANFNGRIGPIAETALAFPMNGQVAEVFVERGETVLAGLAIARLDTSDLERELALAQTALTVAQAQLAAVESTNASQRQRAELALALAQLDLDFATAQAGDFPTAEQTYQIARLTILRDLAQLAVDELATAVDPQLYANVQQAELRVAELEAAIANTILTAPTDGILVSLNLTPGRPVVAEAPIGTLADLEELEISANLQPSQMNELSEGMPVTMALANRPGETFTGFIRQMPYPYGTRGSADVEPTDTSTRFAFDNPEDAQQFQPGDRMNVIVLIKERPGVLWLPPAAVREFNGRTFVVVQDAQSQSRVDVTLGIEGDGRVEILEGLTEGQVIVGQ